MKPLAAQIITAGGNDADDTSAIGPAWSLAGVTAAQSTFPCRPWPPRILLLAYGRYHPSRSGGPARDHLCYHFPRVCLGYCCSPRVAVLSVITGLIPAMYMLHICFYIPQGLISSGKLQRVKSRIQPALALVYRGDASQQSACAPADQRCYRHPPSTLFYRLKLMGIGFSTGLPAAARRQAYAEPLHQEPFPSKPEKGSGTPNPGLGGSQTRIGLFSSSRSIRGFKILIQHVDFIHDQQRRDLIGLDFHAVPLFTASIFSCTRTSAASMTCSSSVARRASRRVALNAAARSCGR